MNEGREFIPMLIVTLIAWFSLSYYGGIKNYLKTPISALMLLLGKGLVNEGGSFMTSREKV
jgi:hypothetical protein